MKISHLAEFVELAKAPSISEAARSMHYAHQTLSKHLEEMERELGCKLVTRDIPLRLTPSGVVLLRRASAIVKQYEEMTQELWQVKSSTFGTVRILAYDHIPFSWYLSKVIASMREKYPNVRIDFQKAVRMDSAQALREDRVDIGYRVRISSRSYVQKLDDSEFRYTKIDGYHDQLFFGVSKNNPLAARQGEPITLAELCAQPFVVPSFNYKSMLPLAVESFLQAQGLRLSYTIVVCESMDEFYMTISDEGVYPLADNLGMFTAVPRTFGDSIVRIDPVEGPFAVEAFMMTEKNASKPAIDLFLEEFLLSMAQNSK